MVMQIQYGLFAMQEKGYSLAGQLGQFDWTMSAERFFYGDSYDAEEVSMDMSTPSVSVASVSVEVPKLELAKRKMRDVSMLIETEFCLEPLDQSSLGVENQEVIDFIVNLYSLRMKIDTMPRQELDYYNAWALQEEIFQLNLQWSSVYSEVSGEPKQEQISSFVARNFEKLYISLKQKGLERPQALLNKLPDQTIKNYYDQYYRVVRKICEKEESKEMLAIDLRLLGSVNPCKDGKYENFKEIIQREYFDQRLFVKDKYEQKNFKTSQEKKDERELFSIVDELSQELTCSESLDVKDVFHTYQAIIYKYHVNMKLINYYDAMAQSSIESIEQMIDTRFSTDVSIAIDPEHRTKIKNFFVELARARKYLRKINSYRFVREEIGLLRENQLKLYHSCLAIKDNALFDKAFGCGLYNRFADDVDVCQARLSGSNC